MTCYVERKPNNGFVYPHNTISPLVIRVCYSLMGTSGISRCLKHRLIELQRESLQKTQNGFHSLTNRDYGKYNFSHVIRPVNTCTSTLKLNVMKKIFIMETKLGLEVLSYT